MYQSLFQEAFPDLFFIFCHLFSQNFPTMLHGACQKRVEKQRLPETWRSRSTECSEGIDKQHQILDIVFFLSVIRSFRCCNISQKCLNKLKKSMGHLIQVLYFLQSLHKLFSDDCDSHLLLSFITTVSITRE